MFGVATPGGGLTLAVAMLCLSLFSSAATPISDCRTAWTWVVRSAETAVGLVTAVPLVAPPPPPFSPAEPWPRDMLFIRSRTWGKKSDDERYSDVVAMAERGRRGSGRGPRGEVGERGWAAGR